MLFEVDLSQIATVCLHESVDFVRDLAFVKSVSALLSDQSQTVRERWIFENVTLRRCAAFAVEGVNFEESAGKIFMERNAAIPVESDQLRDRKSLFRIMNRAGEI